MNGEQRDSTRRLSGDWTKDSWEKHINQGGKEKQPFIAEAMDPLGADADLMAKMIFAENAPGGPEAWANIGSVALNRLKSGKFGKSLKAVINGMSSAIKTKSKQWEKANKAEFNEFLNEDLDEDLFDSYETD